MERDTLLPKVHTASQQGHRKLQIDTVRFYHTYISTLKTRSNEKKCCFVVGNVGIGIYKKRT